MQARAVKQKVDSDIYRINHYRVDSIIGFANAYHWIALIHPLYNWGQDCKDESGLPSSN